MWPPCSSKGAECRVRMPLPISPAASHSVALMVAVRARCGRPEGEAAGEATGE